MYRSTLLALASALVLSTTASTAFAQQLALPALEGRPGAGVSGIAADLSVGGVGRFGANIDRETLATAGLDLRLRRGVAADRHLALYLQPQIEYDVNGNESVDLVRDTRGRYGLSGRYTLREDDGSGLVFAFEADAEHAGQRRYLRPQLDIGGSPYIEGGFSAGLWIYRTLDFMRSVQVAIPVIYSYRTIQYDAGTYAPISDRETHSVHSGFGIRPQNNTPDQGWYELMGVTYGATRSSGGHMGDLCVLDHTGSACYGDDDIAMIEEERWELASGGDYPFPSRMLDVESVHLDAVHVDRLRVLDDDGIQLFTDFSIGGAWLWDQTQERSASAFASKVGLLVRPSGHMGGFGFNFRTGPMLTPDARLFANVLSLEGMIEWSDPAETIGASFRAGVDWIDPDVDTEEAVEMPGRVALRTGWFTQVVPGVRLDIHHVATNVPDAEGVDWILLEHENLWHHRFGGAFTWDMASGAVLGGYAQDGPLSCTRRGCQTTNGLGNHLDATVPWNPCHGEPFRYEAEFDFENSFDYVDVGNQRLTGRNATAEGRIDGATNVHLHTDGSVQSGGLRSLRAFCGETAAPPPNPEQALVCVGTHCATTAGALPPAHYSSTYWDPCGGQPFSWQAHVDFEPGYDHATIAGTYVDGWDTWASGQSSGAGYIELGTDGSVDSRGILSLDATCTPVQPPQQALECVGASCVTPFSPIPHSTEVSVTWDPCYGQAFGYWGNVSFESGFDFLMIGEETWSGYDIPIEGYVYGPVTVRLHTDGSVDSPGIYNLTAECASGIAPTPLPEEPLYYFEDELLEQPIYIQDDLELENY